jgi:hypothetical protein
MITPTRTRLGPRCHASTCKRFMSWKWSFCLTCDTTWWRQRTSGMTGWTSSPAFTSTTNELYDCQHHRFTSLRQQPRANTHLSLHRQLLCSPPSTCPLPRLLQQTTRPRRVTHRTGLHTKLTSSPHSLPSQTSSSLLCHGSEVPRERSWNTPPSDLPLNEVLLPLCLRYRDPMELSSPRDCLFLTFLS